MRRYDLIIIGGGVAGLVAASGALRFGARVAIIDNVSLGGDCLRTGCVPTKRLIHSAKMASQIKRAGEFGIMVDSFKVDFHRVMDSMRQTQTRIGEHDNPERFRRMGAEVFFGKGSFIDSHIFEVNKERLQGRKFIIATGSRPVEPAIKGLKETGALTNETALSLDVLPESIIILGGGPIGIEFSQILGRLGSKVTVVERQGQILSKEDKEIADALKNILEDEGIKFELSAKVEEVARTGDKKEVVIDSPSGKKSIIADEVMIAAGRAPNIDGLGLDSAGVESDRKKGIKVDDHLQTTQKHIFACGDCVGHYAFTHVAEYHAGIALGNALFPFAKRKLDYRVVPWTTFSDPELARVGMTEAEAKAKYGEKDVAVYRFDFKNVDRAVIEGEGKGIIKVVCASGGRILGAHILGPHGGELIHEYVLAMKAEVPITGISRTIHVYPTDSMGVKRAADEYYTQRLFSGRIQKAAKWIVRRGGIG